LDVLHDQVTGIKTLGIGVGFGVLEETEKELGRLDWPSGAGDTKLLAYNFISTSPRYDSMLYTPCAARPVPPAYRLIGTASLCSWTFSRNLMARCSFQPLMACYRTCQLPEVAIHLRIPYSCFASVLEAYTEVSTTSTSAFGRSQFGSRVSHL
jgi:hypothetical protein